MLSWKILATDLSPLNHSNKEKKYIFTRNLHYCDSPIVWHMQPLVVMSTTLDSSHIKDTENSLHSATKFSEFNNQPSDDLESIATSQPYQNTKGFYSRVLNSLLVSMLLILMFLHISCVHVFKNGFVLTQTSEAMHWWYNMQNFVLSFMETKHLLPVQYYQSSSQSKIIASIFHTSQATNPCSQRRVVWDESAYESAGLKIKHLKGKAIFTLAFRAHLCMSKGIKAKQDIIVLSGTVYVWSYFVRKAQRPSQVALKNEPF